MEELLDLIMIDKAQQQLDAQLRESLLERGEHRLSFRPGGKSLSLHAEGRSGLYYASTWLPPPAKTPRFWNAFGLYDGKVGHPQKIIVEINIAKPPSRRVAGFFARRSDSPDIFLLHDGKIGGGKKGVCRSGFLAHSGLPLRDVKSAKGHRRGIVVARVSADNLVRDIASFVRAVAAYKEFVD